MNNGAEERKKQGIFTSLAGLMLNILLATGKLVAGIVSGSVSIISDAANNFSDSAAGIVTVSSFTLANRKADKEHPLGHGRYEYVAGLIIGVMILVVGIEFVRTGIDRIVNPQAVVVGVLGIVILSASIAVKLFMTIFYRIAAKKLNSSALKAASADSFFDVLTTLVVLVSFLLNKVLPFQIDGFCTVFVSAVIIWGGAKVILEASNKLVGNGASPELVEQLYSLVLQSPDISGAHDLIVHDYGPSKKVGTLHAEFDRDLTISRAHTIIDEIENAALEQFGVELVIHVDPIDFSNPVKNKLRKQIYEVLSHFKDSSIHELTLDAENKTIAFDIKTVHQNEHLKQSIVERIKRHLATDFADFSFDINFDILY